MNKIELLSPVGDFECLKAAVQNGADAIYLGASSFSARAKATNFDKNELLEAIKYAKLRNVSVHLALNTLIKNDEFNDAVNLAIDAYNLGVDAIIIQDLGLASFLLKNYPEIPLHASTQMTIHNLDGVKQLESFGFSRVVLARELSIDEIKHIRENTSIELEVFIHGALCISYSGQCLLSSMIGGRSGNRGLCAQPCRLPYELYEENITGKNTLLDKGYLLSPRDNCGITFLPELIKSGITSLKIEGRMKTPTYVGTVTRIYRKYIDLLENNINLDCNALKNMILEHLNIKNEETNLSDLEELTQVFNRGNFSTGHLSSYDNKELIFKDKPNNMGIYVGTISHINENKGHLTLKLEEALSIGDKISINNESYTISELMINNKNFDTLSKGSTVKIGRMKGKISVGSKIYRIETQKLNKFIFPTFKEDKNLKKVYLNGKITIKENSPICLQIWSNCGYYEDLICEVSLPDIPSSALNKPLTKEKVLEQICKTGNTEFEFSNLDVDLDANLFIQMSTLNNLRRIALEKLEKLVIEKNTHNLEKTSLKSFSKIEKEQNSNTKISLLLNILNLNFDYSSLENIDKVYIPLKYFTKEYFNVLSNVVNSFDTYIYMPHIIKDDVNLDNIISKLKIKGFVISHISQLDLVAKYNLELIGNFNLNIYNNYSVNELKNLNFTTHTISPELNKSEVSNICQTSSIKSEIIVYGKLPVMTNNYCYIGHSNKCYKECNKKCLSNSKFYLKDRMNFKFRVIPDNSISTIYNSKILSITYENIDSVRIDILDEPSSEIQNIIDTVKSGKRFEGKDFTNGYYN